MASENDSLVTVALRAAGGGVEPVRTGRASLFDVDGAFVHTRWKSADSKRPFRFPFNLGAAALDWAEFEMWICGHPELYYLVPTGVLSHFHAHPLSQRDRRHPDLVVLTVFVDDDVAVFSKELRLDLRPYRCASLPSAARLIAPSRATVAGAAEALPESGDAGAAREEPSAATAGELTSTPLSGSGPAGLEAEPSEFGYEFEPVDDVDAARRVTREILVRQGGAQFRAGVLTAYGAACFLTGSRCLAVLEAAHVRPFAESLTNHVSNGLLLRSDVHTLFDRGLVGIDTRRTPWQVVIAPVLVGTEYESCLRAGRLPSFPGGERDLAALAMRLEEHRVRSGLEPPGG